MERMDSWECSTAFMILDCIIPSEGEARAILHRSLPLTVEGLGKGESNHEFLLLLRSTLSACQQLIELTLNDAEIDSSPSEKHGAELALVTEVLFGEHKDARSFWLAVSRIAQRLSRGPEHDWCTQAFRRVSEWLSGNAEFPLQTRLRLLEILKAHFNKEEHAEVMTHA